MLWALGSTAFTAGASAAGFNPRDTSVQMFHWRWTDIAKECREWLGPQGYGGVQISPPSAAQKGVHWYDIYQPVDYMDLNSKMGSAGELKAMIDTCHASGVRVYADVVINHLAADSGTATNGATWNAQTLSYPRFGANDFHANCDIQRSDYGTPGNRSAVTNCRLSGLPDLDTADASVQARIREYLNLLVDTGIDGFRIDAAKHIELPELLDIFKGVRRTTRQGEPLWVTQEAIADGNMDFRSYLAVGTVNEFKYPAAMRAAFRNEKGASISKLPAIIGTPGRWGGSWGFVDSASATVFVNNWDTERKDRSMNASNRTGALNDTVGTRRYNLANIFMLAWPYGEAQLHSGFNFKGKDDDAPAASPFDANGRPRINQDWDFIHRWPDISNMVAFRSTTSGEGVDGFTTGTDNQIAFSRGARGFVAINNEQRAWTRAFQTSLAPGIYCNVIQGGLNAAGTDCSGDKLTVDAKGMVAVTVPADGGPLTPAVALHVNQRVGGAAASHVRSGASILVSGAQGMQLRVTPYGDQIVRLQTIRAGESHFKDDHYEMVESHALGGSLAASEDDSRVTLRLGGASGIRLEIDKKTLSVSYFTAGLARPVLQEEGAVRWQGDVISRAFVFDDQEHFTGLGHSYFGRAQSIDLKGQATSRNYGKVHSDQAPLLVPFYLSSKGYGVFLNSTFRNHFSFGADQRYEFGIDTLGYAGRMDYFFIAGPRPKDVLAHYVGLTGKPRLPAKAIFGLALSDKGHDHDSATPSDEAWWKKQIGAHRAAGFPLDHVVNDNRWRAGGGKRCESHFDWDRGRYPDPAEYAAWLKNNGLVATLDFNRCIAQYSEGWQAAFSLPEVGAIDFNKSAPDLTNPKFRDWFWQTFLRKSLDPALKFPGDALWIDEFDEMGVAPEKMILANGLSSAEMRNYWFFLIAKALVQQGWDRSDVDKRPYVWVRGMTAGAQRYASLWSGDIKTSFDEMKLQIRGMQLAGLSGFPFWGHDAGGFQGHQHRTGPEADVYMQWSMAMGSFSPIWKPHGVGLSRWPLDRSAQEQAVAHRFARLRYELMPYTYTAAHEAARTGLPMARAMLLEYPEQPQAWKYDLQYMWGPDLLVAPSTSADQAHEVWLPPGQWFDFWHPQAALPGGRVVSVKPELGKLPLFVKAGAIIPGQRFVLSTAFGDKSTLRLDVYAGADGHAELIEDDDVTEAYRRAGKLMKTSIDYDAASSTIRIAGAKGDYANAPRRRSYQVTVHGPRVGTCFTVDGKRAKATRSGAGRGTTITVARTDIRKDVTIRACRA